MKQYSFKSLFAPHFNSFLKMKDAMGFGLVKFKVILKEIDLFLVEKKVFDLCITQSLIVQWLTTFIYLVD